MKKEHTFVALLPERCRRPQCKREAKAFGLCGSCYHVARDLVLNRVTTWAFLQKSGKAAERRRTAKQWLLEGTELLKG